jgi:hypothetical protein
MEILRREPNAHAGMLREQGLQVMLRTIAMSLMILVASGALLPSHDPPKIQPRAKGISALSMNKSRQRLHRKRA